jgi:hypothetical protein
MEFNIRLDSVDHSTIHVAAFLFIYTVQIEPKLSRRTGRFCSLCTVTSPQMKEAHSLDSATFLGFRAPDLVLSALSPLT